MNVREWREVAQDASDILGEGWNAVGRGRYFMVARVPVEWYLSAVMYESTSAGRLVAYQAVLSRPLPATQLGDDGIWTGGGRYLDGFDDRVRINDGDPRVVVTFARLSDSQVMAPKRDLNSALLFSESKFSEHAARGVEKVRQLYTGSALHRIVVRRIMVGSRPPEDLLYDIKWALRDAVEHPEPAWGERSGTAEANWYVRYFSELRDLVAKRDRAAVEDLMLRTRAENLRLRDVPAELVAEVRLPEPEVAW